MKTVKSLIKKVIGYSGYKVVPLRPFPPGSPHNPMGFIPFVEGLKHRGLKCETFLDGGAASGDVSRLVKKNYPQAKCILIEPMKEMEPVLKKFCSQFKDSKYIPAGLAGHNGTLTFTVSEALGGSSFLPERNEELINKGRQRDVKVVTIDSLIESGEIDIPQFIKLDIQGFEMEALKAATKTFGVTEVYLLEAAMFHFDESPTIPVFTELVNFMYEKNYVPYEFPGFLRRPYDGALGSCDVAFVKENGFLRKSGKW